jgi:cysteine desulfurase
VDTAVYLDCNATTPVEPEIADEVVLYMTQEFGNAGSRTHEFGVRAKHAVEQSRRHIAAVVSCKPDEVVFTSGATESNNLAIFGLASYGLQNEKRHIVSTQIEHKAVLEPLASLESKGFEVTLIKPKPDGRIDPVEVRGALRDDTLLVSVMHVNNETGVRQPIGALAELLADHPAFFHVDAAQGFGKDILPLQNERIDFISISGHKIYAPKGIGALITRRRGYSRVPLEPLIYGGGQERGLRAGTLPVHLVVGLGKAAEIALRDQGMRNRLNLGFREKMLDALLPLAPVFNGDPELMLPTTVNLSFPNLDSEALMVALRSEVAISNGSACTSHSYEPSHVLSAMGVAPEIIRGAIRISWCHLTEVPDWASVARKIKSLL